MKILLFGKDGQVGWELQRGLLPLGEVHACSRKQIDLADDDTLRNSILQLRPDIIVNSAAYTSVDDAEEDEVMAMRINAAAPGVIAGAAVEVGALLVHYSTDYVFDGTSDRPYTEQDKPAPLNIYGRSKYEGELTIADSGCDYIVFRTSWVFAARGNNFLRTILRLAAERDELSIIDDQIGAPTPARLIADVTVHCLRASIARREQGVAVSGLYHLTTSGAVSWYGYACKAIEFAREQMPAMRLRAALRPISSADYPSKALRPQNSMLDTTRLRHEFNLQLPDWEKGLALSIAELT